MSVVRRYIIHFAHFSFNIDTEVVKNKVTIEPSMGELVRGVGLTADDFKNESGLFANNTIFFKLPRS